MEQNAIVINDDIVNRFNNGCKHFENAFIARRTLDDAKRKIENRECVNEIFGALELFIKEYINEKNSNYKIATGRYLLSLQEKTSLKAGQYNFPKLVELVRIHNKVLELPLQNLDRLIELKPIRNWAEHDNYEPDFEKLKESLILIYEIFKDFPTHSNLENAKELIDSLLSDDWLVNKIADNSIESIKSKIDSIKDYLNTNIDKETKEKYEAQISELEQQKANLEKELHKVHEQISKIDISTASKLFRKAYQCYCNGDIEKALEVLDEKILRQNELWSAQNRLLKAFLLHLLNQTDESHKNFYKAFQIQPKEMQHYLSFFPNTIQNTETILKPISQPLGAGIVLPTGSIYPPNNNIAQSPIDINTVVKQLAEQIINALLGKNLPQPQQADSHIADNLKLIVMNLQEKIRQLENIISNIKEPPPHVEDKPDNKKEVGVTTPKSSENDLEDDEDIGGWWNSLEEQWQTVFAMKFNFDKKMPNKEVLKGIIKNTEHFIFHGNRSLYLGAPIALTNISGILALKNLKTLDLSYHKIENLKGIERLSHLEEITLHMNELKTVKGVEHLPKLKKLEIPQNKDIPDQEMITLQKNRPDLIIICEQKKEDSKTEDITKDPRWHPFENFFHTVY